MNNNKNKILLIDDDCNIWKDLLHTIFPENEYYIKLKEDIKSIQNLYEYDVLIVDYILGKDERGDQWIKKNVRNKDPFIPVVFWTSSYDPQIIRKTLIGNKVFLKKHLNISEFKKEIDKSINEYRKYKNFPLYNDFFNTKIIDKKNRELAHKVYINTSKYLESFFSHSKYHAVFNAYGLIHTQNVLNNLSRLLYPISEEFDKDGNKNFTEDDYVIAYISVILHDFGMMPVKYNDDMEFSEFHKIRKNHCRTIYWWVVTGQIEKLLDFKFDSEFQRYAIGVIDLFHDGHYSFSDFLDFNSINYTKFFEKTEEISDIYDSIHFKWEKLYKSRKKFLENDVIKYKKLKILASLVALADKLDYGSSRVPIDVIRKSPYRGLHDEFEYLINECFLSYDFKQKGDKTVIEIETIDFKSKPKLYDISFKAFQHEIKNGIVTPESYKIAAYILENIIEEKWGNIHEGFKDCKIDFLKKLEIEFSASSDNKGMKNYNLFSEKIPFIFKNVDGEGSEGLDIFEKELIKYVFKEGYKETLKKEALKYEVLSTGFSSEKVLLFPHLKKQVSSDKEYFCELELNNVLLKIGDFKKIHTEVKNYRNYAVPYINPRSLIGYIEEFKYLDKGAFTSLITPEEAKTLDDSIKYDDLDKILDGIKISLDIFFDKINPFESNKIKKELADNLKNKISELNDISVDDKKVLENIGKEVCKILVDPQIKITSSISHGDFTFRNILSLGDDLIFIDFAKTGVNHFFLDAAKLEHFIICERFITNENETDEKIINEILDCYLGQVNKDRDNLSEIQQNILMIQRTINKFLNYKIKKVNIKTNISFEMNIARLFVNIWSLKYTKDFYLSIDERMNLIETIMKKLSNQKNL